MTTTQIRTEYRRAPKLSILLHDTPLFECIRNGIDQGLFIYREGSQVWGPGDPRPCQGLVNAASTSAEVRREVAQIDTALSCPDKPAWLRQAGGTDDHGHRRPDKQRLEVSTFQSIASPATCRARRFPCAIR